MSFKNKKGGIMKLTQLEKELIKKEEEDWELIEEIHKFMLEKIT